MSTQAVRDPNRWAVLAVVGVAQLMVVLDPTIVTVALPSAQHALHFSTESRQWVVTAYALAFGSLLLVGGKVGDLFGRKWALIIGLVGFSAASAVGGLAQSFGVLVAARATQGVFAALLAPSALSLLTVTFAGTKDWAQRVRDLRRGRRRRRGDRAAARGCADAGALVALVPVRQSGDRGADRDRRVAPAGQPQAPDRARIDVPGTLTWTLGLFALVFGFSNAETHGWGATATVVALIASPLLLTAFVLTERRVKHPLLPLHIVWDRARGGSYTALFVTGAGIFAVFLFLTYFMQRNLGFSPLKTGLAFLPLSAVLIITSTTVQTRVIQRTGVKPLVLLGMALGVVGMLLFTQLTPTSSYATGVLPGLLVIGVGMGCIFAPAFSAGTLGVAQNEAGIASAHGQHVPTDRRLDRHVAALNDLRHRRRQLPHQPSPRPRPHPRRGGPRRHDGILVGRRDLWPGVSAHAGDPARPLRDPPGDVGGRPGPTRDRQLPLRRVRTTRPSQTGASSPPRFPVRRLTTLS